MFEFNSVGILALVAVAMCWSLAAVLYRVGTSGSVARKLALLLAVEGATLVSTGYLDLMLTDALQASPSYARWLQFEFFVHTLGDCLMLVLYPSFLAAALRTPLTQPLATSRARIATSVIAAALFVAVYQTPLAVGATLLYLMLSLLFAYALVASLHAWRNATGGARDSAKSFALAFGIRQWLRRSLRFSTWSPKAPTVCLPTNSATGSDCWHRRC